MSKKLPKLLSGSELAGFIKERQAKQARQFFAEHNRKPKLAILKTVDDPRITTYVNLKKRYGEDIGIEVEIFDLIQNGLRQKIDDLNRDSSTDAIIVQLPLIDPSETDEILALVDPNKDVDGLNPKSAFDSATATAILWLLAGYNIELAGKKIVIVGQGRLVGEPISDNLEVSGFNVTRADKSTKDMKQVISNAEVVITATGQPGLIKSNWLQPGAVVVDAGVAGEEGQLVGDLEAAVSKRNDLIITPQKGGLGPLTVCSLFENVLKAAQKI